MKINKEQSESLKPTIPTLSERVSILEINLENIIKAFNKKNEMLTGDFTMIHEDMLKLAKLISSSKPKESKIIY